MADDEPKRPWKREVYPVLTPAWMEASVERLEEVRKEILVEMAKKKQRETPREGDEKMEEVSEEMAASSSASGPATAGPSSASLPPQVLDDMAKFRHASMTPASFMPQRHLFMCIGRPMVVACFMYLFTPPSFLTPSLCDAPKEHHSIMPWYGIVLGRFQCRFFSDPCIFRSLCQFLWNHFFQSLMCVYASRPRECTGFVVRSSS